MFSISYLGIFKLVTIFHVSLYFQIQSGIIFLRKLRSKEEQLCWQLYKQSDRHARNFSVGRGRIWQVCKEKEKEIFRKV